MLLTDGIINFRILLLKILKLLEFFIFLSKLVYSIIAGGKRELKKLCLDLKKGMFCILIEKSPFLVYLVKIQ